MEIPVGSALLMIPPQGMKDLMDDSAFGLTAPPNRNALSFTNTSNVRVTPEKYRCFYLYSYNHQELE